MKTDSNFPIFIDSNILIYSNNPSQAIGQLARARIQELFEMGHPLIISTQIIREYANVTLRNSIYHKLDLKKSIEDLLFNIAEFQEDFEVIHENNDVLPKWLFLLPRLTTNKDVFDFNIVATLQAHGIQHILTHNVNDFSKFSDWLTILPLFTEKAA